LGSFRGTYKHTPRNFLCCFVWIGKKEEEINIGPWLTRRLPESDNSLKFGGICKGFADQAMGRDISGVLDGLIEVQNSVADGP